MRQQICLSDARQLAMNKSTDFWKLATISLLALTVMSFGVYFVAFNSTSKNSSIAETFPQNNQPKEDSIPINQKAEIKTRKRADYSWIPIYFKTIDKRTEAAQIPKLKSSSLPENDLEVRFWFPGGILLLEGFILKKQSGQWSAVYLEGVEEKINKIQYQNNKNEYQKELPEPISGWDAAWKSLVDKGILNLPDATEMDCNESAIDGFSFIAEYKVNGIYRTYKYDNPSDKEPKCPEAKQVSDIYEIIRDEFRFREYKL